MDVHPAHSLACHCLHDRGAVVFCFSILSCSASGDAEKDDGTWHVKDPPADLADAAWHVNDPPTDLADFQVSEMEESDIGNFQSSPTYLC